MLVLALVLAGCGDDDDAATTTRASETAGPDETTETTGPSGTSPAPLVLASNDGVTVVSGDDVTQVSTAPAGAAYGIETDLVVFQDADPQGAGFYPPGVAGPVRVWSDGEVRDLPTDPAARRVELLDARLVDGVPTVLVSERFGEVSPEDTFEELVQIDLREDTRTTVARQPAWESGHAEGRLLPDGDVVGLLFSGTIAILDRWSADQEEAVWSLELGQEISVDLAIRDGAVTVIETSFDAERGLAPEVTVSTHDVESGTAAEPRRADIDDPDGTIETGLFCRDWLSPSELACGRSGGPPVAIDVDAGSFRELPGEPGAMPTVVRSD